MKRQILETEATVTPLQQTLWRESYTRALHYCIYIIPVKFELVFMY